MEIRVLDKSGYGEYEEFLFSSEKTLFYHSVKYKDFLEDLLGCESQYLLAYENGKITGALPLMIKDGPYGKVINSLPYYGSNGGIISQSNNVFRTLLEEYNNFIRKSDVLSATIIENPLNKLQATPIHNSTDIRIGQFTYIQCKENFEEETFKRISGNKRNEIRRAQKHGVEVFEESDQLDFIRITHQYEMRENNRKHKRDDFFNKVKTHFEYGKDYKIFIARRNEEPIAGLLMFYFNKVAEYFTPVVLGGARIYQPMSLVLYHVFLDAMKQGYEWINLGGTWVSQEGVYRFKNQMGAQDKSYSYYTQVNNADILKYDPVEILSMYPDFYVFNFNNMGLLR